MMMLRMIMDDDGALSRSGVRGLALTVASGLSVVFWKLSAAGSTYFQLVLNKILWILFFSLGILTSAAFARGFSLGFTTSGELFLSLGVFPASIFFCFVGFGLASPLERSVSISSFE